MANRFWGARRFTDVQCHEERLDDPLHWKKPSKIFVNSMSDLFHEDVPDKFINDVFDTMEYAAQHTYIILTKRPDRMCNFIHNYWIETLPLAEHIWLGVSVENQQVADERIPLLLQTPAAVRFVSVEPMLGPVDIRKYLLNLSCDHFAENPEENEVREGVIDCYRPENVSGKCSPINCPFGGYDKLDWIICGGESGPGARPIHPDWVRSLRDQCQEAGVPFFLKQMHIDGKLVKMPELDGKVWDEFPEAM